MVTSKKQILILVSNGFPEPLILSLVTALRAAARPVAVVGFSHRAVTGAEGTSLQPDVSLEELLRSNGSVREVVLAIPPGMEIKQRLQIDPRAEFLITRLVERDSTILIDGGNLSVLTQLMPAAGPFLTAWKTAEPDDALAQLLLLTRGPNAQPLASAAYATD